MEIYIIVKLAIWNSMPICDQPFYLILLIDAKYALTLSNARACNPIREFQTLFLSCITSHYLYSHRNNRIIENTERSVKHINIL